MTPTVVVTRGAPDDEELAAVLAVVALLRGRPPRQPAEPAPAPWTRSDRAYRPPGSWSSRPVTGPGSGRRRPG